MPLSSIPGIQWIRDWIDPRSGLDPVEKIELFITTIAIT
jgi:hypothetical protein